MKDDLGVDELKTYNDAKSRYETSIQNKQEADHKLGVFERASRGQSHREYDYDRSHDLYRSSIYWKETTEKRGREYMSARSDLMKTPIGKLIPAKETIEKGTRFIDNIISSIKKRLEIK